MGLSPLSASASASASTSAAAHREHSPHLIEEADVIEGWSRDCSLCEDSSEEITDISSEEGYGTVSSSESEVDALLRKEAKRILEKNKGFLRAPRESSSSSESSKSSRHFLENYCADGRDYSYERSGYYYMYPESYYSPTESPLKHRNLALTEALSEIKLSKKNSSPVRSQIADDEESKVETEGSPSGTKPSEKSTTLNNCPEKKKLNESDKKKPNNLCSDKKKTTAPTKPKKKNKKAKKKQQLSAQSQTTKKEDAPNTASQEKKKAKPKKVPRTSRKREFEEDRTNKADATIASDSKGCSTITTEA